MISVFLWLDIREIFFLCTAFKEACRSMQAHILIIFFRATAKIVELRLFWEYGKLKAESGQPDAVLAHIRFEEKLGPSICKKAIPLFLILRASYKNAPLASALPRFRMQTPFSHSSRSSFGGKRRSASVSSTRAARHSQSASHAPQTSISFCR